MIPFQQLRTNNLYGGGGNPLGINPIRSNPDLVTEFAERILPLIHGEEDRKATMNQKMLDQMRARQLLDNNPSQKNVVYNPAINGINPLAAANLNLKQQAEQGKDTRNAENNDTRTQLAGSSNDLKQQAITGQNDRAANALAEKTQFGQTENTIRQQMADVAQFRSLHPDIKPFAVPGGTYHYYNPATQQMIDTGIDSGKATDEQKAALGLSNVEQEIQARGDQTRITNTTKQQNTPQTSNQQKTDTFNKAQQLSTDPNYSKYIKLNPGNTFTIDPSAPPDVYHDIGTKIYGQDTQLPAGNNGTTTLTNTPQPSNNTNSAPPVLDNKDPLGLLDNQGS